MTTSALELAARSATVMAVAYAAVGAPPLLSESELDAIRQTDLPDRADDRANERSPTTTPT